MAQRPSLGRIVHYSLHPGPESVPQAAIITAVHPDDHVTLTVFPPGEEPFAMSDVVEDPSYTLALGAQVGNTWHWPPRVD